jgi:hypothetical protein
VSRKGSGQPRAGSFDGDQRGKIGRSPTTATASAMPTLRRVPSSNNPADSEMPCGARKRGPSEGSVATALSEPGDRVGAFMSPAWRRKQGCAVKLLAIGMGTCIEGSKRWWASRAGGDWRRRRSSRTKAGKTASGSLSGRCADAGASGPRYGTLGIRSEATGQGARRTCHLPSQWPSPSSSAAGEICGKRKGPGALHAAQLAQPLTGGKCANLAQFR